MIYKHKVMKKGHNQSSEQTPMDQFKLQHSWGLAFKQHTDTHKCSVEL